MHELGNFSDCNVHLTAHCLCRDVLTRNQLGETHAIGGGVGGEGTDDMGAIEVILNPRPLRA